MAMSPTGLRPLPWPQRIWRFWLVSWTFLVIYLGYKRIQKTYGLSEEERSRRYRDQHRVTGERLYRLAIRMQGLLIKSCQFLSSRADVAPPELVAVLSRLQDSVPPRSYAEVESQVKRELHAPPEEVFASFEREPLAAASLAQVHRARTHNGRDVAVKVQYLGISRVVETDLRSLSLLIRMLARFEPKWDFRMLIGEMANYVPRELDFVEEGKSAERVAQELSHRKDVRVPEIIWQHTAQRVLTMEYIDGIKISDTDKLLAAGIDPNEVARIMMEAYCEQILVNGFFHADPHPGNLFVLPGPVVVFLDFGMSKHLPEDFRRTYNHFTLAVLSQNDSAMLKGFKDLGFRTQTDDPELLVALGRSFFETAGPEQRPYADSEVIGEVNERLSRLLSENPITKVPSDILLILRVLGLMSGLQKRLDSTVDVANTITPFAQSQIGEAGDK
ncbi:MAG: hypothetical protein CL897_01570 [Dehalococcoidia bacterium]|nr:hypothetical protein [Dehalococcoidia bacterium]|tara:strand:+ start:5626 stop:6960 length:1335 start_codon:yes stop_codon:yes gene_type:complete